MIVSKARRDRYAEDYILDYNSSSYWMEFYGPESLDYDFWLQQNLLFKYK